MPTTPEQDHTGTPAGQIADATSNASGRANSGRSKSRRALIRQGVGIVGVGLAGLLVGCSDDDDEETGEVITGGEGSEDPGEEPGIGTETGIDGD